MGYIFGIVDPEQLNDGYGVSHIEESSIAALYTHEAVVYEYGLHSSHDGKVKMLVGGFHGVDGPVHKILNGLHHLVGPAVAVSGEIEGTAAKSIDERSYVLVSVHDVNVLPEFLLRDDGLDGVDALDIVWNQVKEESFVILQWKRRCRRRCSASASTHVAFLRFT